MSIYKYKRATSPTNIKHNIKLLPHYHIEVQKSYLKFRLNESFFGTGARTPKLFDKIDATGEI